MLNYDDYFEEALDLFENDENIQGDRTAIARFLRHKYNIKSSQDAVRKGISSRLTNYYADKEIVEQNVKLGKQKQKAQDHNRIANKSFREHARLENALSEFAEAQLRVYKEHSKALKSIKLRPLIKTHQKGVGVMQITDLHGNELVDLPHNKYDFTVMAKRLKFYVSQCIEHFKLKKYNKVAMLFTGDLLNSDRRLDELLNQSTNRAKATSLMRYILTQAILDVRNAGFEITIVSVLGNESRAGKEMPYSNEGLSDNYDFMIMDGIRQMFEMAKIKGVTFKGLDKVEEVVEIDGKNWLMSHDVSRMTSQQTKAQSGIGRYALNGVHISFMIGGHIHATNVTDISARSSSMVGANSFSENALNLAGKAAQNYYLCENNHINTVVVDLQDIDGMDGYEVISQLEAYNAKSVSKLETPKTVFKVVI